MTVQKYSHADRAQTKLVISEVSIILLCQDERVQSDPDVCPEVREDQDDLADCEMEKNRAGKINSELKNVIVLLTIL